MLSSMVPRFHTITRSSTLSNLYKHGFQTSKELRRKFDMPSPPTTAEHAFQWCKLRAAASITNTERSDMLKERADFLFSMNPEVAKHYGDHTNLTRRELVIWGRVAPTIQKMICEGKILDKQVREEINFIDHHCFQCVLEDENATDHSLWQGRIFNDKIIGHNLGGVIWNELV